MRRVSIPITERGESMSSSGAYTPTIRPFFTRRQGYHDHATQASSDNYGWNRPSTVPRPLIHLSDAGGGMQERPWRLFEERVRTGPYGLARFPSQPHSPIRILILHEEFSPAVNPSLQQFIRDSLPRERGQLHTGFNPMEEPGLTPEEFKKARSKLREHVFRPTYPRRSAQTRGLFSRSHSNTTASHPAAAAEDADEGKECTICLDAFVPNQQVLLTPCNHMFHSNCLLPWVENHGKCPVCRHPLVERRGNAISTYNGNNNIIPTDGTADILALIMAMEEAFHWINGVR
ncbi:hypothetical protein MRB53_019979 [Persea americana]|uniref:Uncharacterized protein n=1 Tax=Persea americana TaxID=3435 RepID=A0ACC2L0R6_PERAE|nr:hypothetical protein MRB53_019979 [Persea americana]